MYGACGNTNVYASENEPTVGAVSPPPPSATAGWMMDGKHQAINGNREAVEPAAYVEGILGGLGRGKSRETFDRQVTDPLVTVYIPV